MVLLLRLLLTCRDVHGTVDAADGATICVDADCGAFAHVDVDGCIFGVAAPADDDADVLNLLC